MWRGSDLAAPFGAIASLQENAQPVFRPAAASPAGVAGPSSPAAANVFAPASASALKENAQPALHPVAAPPAVVVVPPLLAAPNALPQAGSLKENARPVLCAAAAPSAGAASLTGPAEGTPRPAHSAKPTSSGTPMVGSQSVGGTIGTQPSAWWNTVGALHRFFGSATGGFASPPLGLEQRRKRPADASVYIDEEFREEEQHFRPAHRTAGSRPASAAASTAAATSAASPVAPAVAGRAAGSAGNPSPLARDALGSALASPQRRGEASGAPRSHQARQPGPGGLREGRENTSEEGEGSSSDDEDMGDKENWLHPAAASGRGAAVVDHGRALRELTLEVLRESGSSDAESSSGGSNFESENLAEQLAERVRQNVDGRYDFEVFEDPEMRE